MVNMPSLPAPPRFDKWHLILLVCLVLACWKLFHDWWNKPKCSFWAKINPFKISNFFLVGNQTNYTDYFDDDFSWNNTIVFNDTYG